MIHIGYMSALGVACSVHEKDFMTTVHQGAPMSALRNIVILIRGWKS